MSIPKADRISFIVSKNILWKQIKSHFQPISNVISIQRISPNNTIKFQSESQTAINNINNNNFVTIYFNITQNVCKINLKCLVFIFR